MEWLTSFRGKIVGLDTAPLIYFIEKHPERVAKLRAFFAAGTAKLSGASFLTNDEDLPSLPGLSVLVVDRLPVS